VLGERWIPLADTGSDRSCPDSDPSGRRILSKPDRLVFERSETRSILILLAIGTRSTEIGKIGNLIDSDSTSYRSPIDSDSASNHRKPN
jgi:hypothetical protein